jgi:hypothetical protein
MVRKEEIRGIWWLSFLEIGPYFIPYDFNTMLHLQRQRCNPI